MKNRRTLRRTTLTVCLLAIAASCGSDGDATPETAPPADPQTNAEEATDETSTTEPPETTPATAVPTTVAPTTTEPEDVDPPVTATGAESTPPSPSDIGEVPFYVIDPTIPADWTCETVSDLAGFSVSFTDEEGNTTVVEARVESDPLTDGVVNTTCTEENFDGKAALFFAAALDAPAAETYQVVKLRFPFANGMGSDRFDTVFEMLSQAEAEAGLYVLVGGGGPVPLDPSEVENFPLAD